MDILLRSAGSFLEQRLVIEHNSVSDNPSTSGLSRFFPFSLPLQKGLEKPNTQVTFQTESSINQTTNNGRVVRSVLREYLRDNNVEPATANSIRGSIFFISINT